MILAISWGKSEIWQIITIPTTELYQSTHENGATYKTGEVAISAETFAKCASILNAPIHHQIHGENANLTSANCYQTSLTIASEIMALPSPNIRKSIYLLLKVINSETGE